MTPEEQEHEEKLAALVAANLSALQTVDAVNRANAGHVSISKGNQRILSLTVDPAERRHAEMLEAIKDLKPKPRPTRKDILTGKALTKRREKPCEKKERIEKFLRDQLAALALLRERDYYKFRERITENNKQELAKHMDARALHRHYRAELADVPNCHLSSVLRAIIAYKIQERYYSVSLSDEDRQKLGDLADDGTRLRPVESNTLPGTRLIRHWQGKDYEATVRSDGRFEFNGEVFGSLSGIARKITGTNWNGKLFWGIK